MNYCRYLFFLLHGVSFCNMRYKDRYSSFFVFFFRIMSSCEKNIENDFQHLKKTNKTKQKPNVPHWQFDRCTQELISSLCNRCLLRLNNSSLTETMLFSCEGQKPLQWIINAAVQNKANSLSSWRLRCSQTPQPTVITICHIVYSSLWQL